MASRLLLNLSLLSLLLSGCASTKQQGQIDPETKKAAKIAAKSMQPSETSVLRSMEERIKNPDMSMEFIPADKAYTANKSFDGKPAYVKDFYISQKTNSKAFRTKSWWGGSKSDPLTDKKFRTKTADTKDYKTETYGTENYDTKDWYMAKKAVAIDQYQTRDFVARGTRQDTFDASAQYNEPMTVDDVRELLNRNR